MAEGYFGADESSYPAQRLRQEIALAILKRSGKTAYPKTLGEGLAAIGDALGEQGQMRLLERQLAAQQQDSANVQKQFPPVTPGPQTEDTTSEPPVRVASAPTRSIPPDEPPDVDTAATKAAATTEPVQPVVAPPTPPVPPAPIQTAVATPTSLPGAVFPPDWRVANSAPPSQLQLPPAPGGNGAFGSNQMALLNGTVRNINQMQSIAPQSPGFQPRSDASGPMNDAQSSQLAQLMGRPGGGGGPAYPPTASLDPTAGAQPMPPPNIRDAITSSILQQQATAGAVPQPNPTQPAPTAPTTISPTQAATAGSPREAAGNRPIVMPDVQPAPAEPTAAPGARLAQNVPMPPENQMPPQVPPPGTPARPVPPPPAEPRVTVPGVQLEPKPPAPFVPEPQTPAQIRFTQEAIRRRGLGDNPANIDYLERQAAELEKIRAAKEAARLDAWKQEQLQYEQNKSASQQFIRETPKRELELQKLEDERQQRAYQEGITRQLGGVPQETYIRNLEKGQEAIAGIPAATDSIRRARTLVDKMYHGPFADTDTFLSGVMASAGFPTDPRKSATEQFKTAMAGVMAQARKGIVGPGAQSEGELALLQKSTAADAKLDPATIRATLDAAESLNLKVALGHQMRVRRFAGENDPDRQAQVYGAYGVPNMVDLVPQKSVDKLFKYSNDPQVHKDFDNTYHTPGLSREVLRYRRPQ